MALLQDAAALKQTQATFWGKNAQQYAADVHEGAGIMMPLIGAYVDTAKSEVKGSPRILDVACGTGEPGISLAKLFSGGHVTMTDFAEGMILEAKRRAGRLSISNASFAIADAEDMGQYADASFDVVTCNCGLMFMPHYERALGEFRRVLKPDGLAMMSAWGVPEQTQLISLMRAMQKMIAPDHGFIADPNILGNREKLTRDVQRAGFSHVSCRDVNVPMHVPADKVRGALLQNAILAELLERLAGKGEGSPAELADRAHAAILQAASERGFLARDGGIQCPTNVALFVTARP